MYLRESTSENMLKMAVLNNRLNNVFLFKIRNYRTVKYFNLVGLSQDPYSMIKCDKGILRFCVVTQKNKKKHEKGLNYQFSNLHKPIERTAKE